MAGSSARLATSFRFAGAIEAVVIGSSTGGPNALAQLLGSIPADLGVPLVVVQHMPAKFTRNMADRLTNRTKLDVREAENGLALGDAHVWIAPGDFHLYLTMEAGIVRLRTNQDQPENSCRPSVDVLFRSAATVFGSNVLAVVLTGMGQDGLAGAECIGAAGGRILVQDQKSSVVWGMPGAISRAGLADEVLPLDMIAPQIVRAVKKSRIAVPRDPPTDHLAATIRTGGSSVDLPAARRGRSQDESPRPERHWIKRNLNSSTRVDDRPPSADSEANSPDEGD